jgi:hypothetical protein
MLMILKWKYLLLGSCLLVFIFGSYVGYLNALVDLDFALEIRRVEANDDTEYLKFQAERLESILVAKRRAVLRRQQQLLDDQSFQGAPVTVPSSEYVSNLDDRIVENPIVIQEPPAAGDLVIPSPPPSALALELERDEQELGALEVQYETIVNLRLRRELQQQRSDDSSAGDSISSEADSVLGGGSFSERVKEILDKRRELSVVAQTEHFDEGLFWRNKGFSDFGGVQIVIQDAEGMSRELDSTYASMIAGALSLMPSGFSKRLDTLYIVYGDRQMSRGMAGVRKLFMNGHSFSFAVLVHELGHIYDLYPEVTHGVASSYVDGGRIIYANDPSATFYAHSWSDSVSISKQASSFVSGYSMSDPFEDFAETWAAFVLQKNYFKHRADQDSILASKYDFVLQSFGLLEFESGSGVYSTLPYDITLLPFDLQVLFGAGSDTLAFASP